MEKYQRWLQHIRTYRLSILPYVDSVVSLKGTGAELGAGTSWFSAELSKRDAIIKIVAIDVDEKRLALAKNFFVPKFGGHKDKIKFIVGDFHCLPFPAGSLDFVVIDAALHHSNAPEKLLREIKRVLKQDAYLIAIREPVLPIFPGLCFWKKLSFGFWQRLHGDTEHAYAKREWKKLFKVAGLSLQIKEYYLRTTWKERLLARLHRLNGVLYGRYFFVAKNTDNCE